MYHSPYTCTLPLQFRVTSECFDAQPVVSRLSTHTATGGARDEGAGANAASSVFALPPADASAKSAGAGAGAGAAVQPASR